MSDYRPLTDDERALLRHVSMFGSDGYPIMKLRQSGRWTWGPWRSINGPPAVFKTRREAVASFERFVDVLREAHGAEAREHALVEQANRAQVRADLGLLDPLADPLADPADL